MKNTISTIGLVFTLVFSFAHAEQHLEESLSGDWKSAPSDISVIATVSHSDWHRTVIQVTVDGVHQHAPIDTRIGLGLIAVAPYGTVSTDIVVDEVTGISTSKPIDHTDISIPNSILHTGTPGIWRDLRVVDLHICPVFLSGEEIVSATSMRIIIETGPGTGINEKAAPQRPISPVWHNLYQRHVLNYQNLDLPRLERGTGKRYIVVSRTRFDSQVQEFVDWKTQQGYGVEVITLEDLGYTNPNSDPAMDATKDFIQNAYETWPEPPEFVLLVGDIASSTPAGSIYTKKFYNYFYSQGNMFYDQWYGYLEGSDLFADVMVGRIPDTNQARMAFQLSKTVDYEKEPYINGSWQKNALMTLRTYHGWWYPDEVDDAITETKEYVSDLMTDWGMNVTDKFQADGTSSQIIPVVNQGLTFYNYRGSSCSSTDWNGSFHSYDVQYLNNSKKLGIWTVLSCSSGNFDNNTCTGEELLRHGQSTPNNPKGAVAFIGSQAYTSYLFNNPLDKGFYHAWTDSGISILGAALLSGKIYAWNNSPGISQAKRESGMKEYTILGDPSLQVWTDVPTGIDVSASQWVVATGTQTPIEISVASASSTPIPSALVCLWMGDDVYTYGYTDASGTVTLTVDPVSEGNISVTVTGYNRIPYIGTITATGSPIPKTPVNVSISIQGGSDTVLTWSPVTEDMTGSLISIDYYAVYRAGTAFFTVDGLAPVGNPVSCQFTDYGVSEDAGVQYFYRIEAVSNSGQHSTPSTPVGFSTYDIEQ